MGGLGNYMFQISAAYSVSKRDGKELICDYSDHMVPHKPFSEYTNNLFRKIKFSNGIGKYTHVGESGFKYNPIPENISYKILRNQGILDKLHNHRDKLHDASLSLEKN